MICYIVRGLSGSGKSTLAQSLAFGAGIESRPRDYICSADDYFMVGDEYKFDVRLLGAAHNKCFSKFLNLVRAKEPVVIIDNTNVVTEECQRYYTRARKEGYAVEVVEPNNELWTTVSNKLNAGIMPDDADLLPLAKRNTHGVTLDIIKRRAKLWVPHDQLLKELAAAYVEPNPELPRCIIVDIDGTIALKGSRSAYNWHNVWADTTNEPVNALLQSVIQDNQDNHPINRTQIIFLSGRDSVCRGQTQDWLNSRGFEGCPLFMRAEMDSRRDTLIKRELFDQHIRNQYNVQFVLDDRDAVVSMWRNELGLSCFQVQEGDF